MSLLEVVGGLSGQPDKSAPARDLGIVVKNAILHETAKSRWIAWPATPNDGGNWTACLSFTATVDRPAFQAACIAAIDRYLTEEDGRDALPLLMP
jgi:hypothetical protein